jgi:hypothetical protein
MNAVVLLEDVKKFYRAPCKLRHSPIFYRL